MFTVEAPAPIARSTTSARKSGSVREPSSGENSTSSVSSRARATDSTVRRTISRFAIRSLNSRCSALVARKTWSRGRGESRSASQAASMSPGTQRASAAIRGALDLAGDGAHRLPVPLGDGGGNRPRGCPPAAARAAAPSAASLRDPCCSRGTVRRPGAWCRRCGRGPSRVSRSWEGVSPESGRGRPRSRDDPGAPKTRRGRRFPDAKLSSRGQRRTAFDRLRTPSKRLTEQRRPVHDHRLGG